MKTKHLWTAVVSGAVLTTLVSNLPFIELVNCLMFAGFWGSAVLTVWLYRRLSGSVTMGEALRIGALTGLFAGLLGFAVSFLGWAGAQGLVNDLRSVVPPEDLSDLENLPASASLAFNLTGVLFNIIFGTLGGWIGGAILRTDREASRELAQA